MKGSERDGLLLTMGTGDQNSEIESVIVRSYLTCLRYIAQYSRRIGVSASIQSSTQA